jgi:translation initiation factor 2 beta subunit (eIF-2beta)/eIF-5
MLKIGSNKISVDIDKANDPFCRYMMSSVIIKDGLKDESKLGQRTILTNLEEIANDLNRSKEMIMAYLSSILGCKYVIDKDDKNNAKWILYGRYTQEKIQDSIYDFISHFILCKHKDCRKPETQFQVEKKNDVVMRCAACSKTSNITANKHTMKVMKLITQKT